MAPVIDIATLYYADIHIVKMRPYERYIKLLLSAEAFTLMTVWNIEELLAKSITSDINPCSKWGI